MTTIMKSEPTPPDREVLTGLAERVTYQNAENGFCVLRVNLGQRRETRHGRSLGSAPRRGAGPDLGKVRLRPASPVGDKGDKRSDSDVHLRCLAVGGRRWPARVPVSCLCSLPGLRLDGLSALDSRISRQWALAFWWPIVHFLPGRSPHRRWS